MTFFSTALTVLLDAAKRDNGVQVLAIHEKDWYSGPRRIVARTHDTNRCGDIYYAPQTMTKKIKIWKKKKIPQYTVISCMSRAQRGQI